MGQKKHSQKSLRDLKNLKKQEDQNSLKSKTYKGIVKELKSLRNYEKDFMEALNKQQVN